jgi:hypothetical protein
MRLFITTVPRQTMNCQLHIVTSFVGLTQRREEIECIVVQQHWMGSKAVFWAPNTAPNKAQHDLRRIMNCQLHIVTLTSFVGLTSTQRKQSVVVPLNGAQSWFFPALQPHAHFSPKTDLHNNGLQIIPHVQMIPYNKANWTVSSYSLYDLWIYLYLHGDHLGHKLPNKLCVQTFQWDIAPLSWC